MREKIRTPGLLIRSQTLYPAELRAHIKLYNKYYYKLAKTSSAGDRDRTGTGGKSRRILSPVRLPVPPRRQCTDESANGTYRARTYDPLLVRQMLSQLS